MMERAGPMDGQDHKVCVAQLLNESRSIKLVGRGFPAPVKNIAKRIVVGDTGCRLLAKHGLYQESNNNSLWPFARIARSVKEAAPDLIIYTGDYIYRESPCPGGDEGCEGSPYGDTELTWESDWLGPARPIHDAAPLVLIRGNHETCSRAGHGWFRYLDAHSNRPECLESTDPWVISFKSLLVD